MTDHNPDRYDRAYAEAEWQTDRARRQEGRRDD